MAPVFQGSVSQCDGGVSNRICVKGGPELWRLPSTCQQKGKEVGQQDGITGLFS